MSPEAAADIRADDLMHDVTANGRRSDLIRALVEDEVDAQYLLDFALDLALAYRDGNGCEIANASTAFDRWLRIKAEHHAADGAA